ncbi:metabotropic glutamate receptor-like [Sarcoptes scabiei]|nr:metabotropic glutamate receptor-like [Sarcoptes scabiei]
MDSNHQSRFLSKDSKSVKNSKRKWILIATVPIFMIALLQRLITIDRLRNVVKKMPGYYEIADLDRNITEMIQSRGFQFEQHFIENEQGYILQLIRIVNPFHKDRNRLKPILLHHGFQGSGSAWLINRNGHLDQDGNYLEYDENFETILSDSRKEIGNSLGFVLAQKNFDVWLANYRGNFYSTNHTRLNVNDEEFWQFSVDDLVHYDYPVMIDYILEKTKRSTLQYIGHSQGSLMMLMLMSSNDHYANKIKPFVALSPVFYGKIELTIFRYLKRIKSLLIRFPGRFVYEENLNRFIATLCSNRYVTNFCLFLSNHFAGGVAENIDVNRIPVYFQHLTMGSSRLNAAHLSQNVEEERSFRYFDFGLEKNLQIYNQSEPIEYDLSRVNQTDIAILFTRYDVFCSMENNEKIRETLKVASKSKF